MVRFRSVFAALAALPLLLAGAAQAARTLPAARHEARPLTGPVGSRPAKAASRASLPTTAPAAGARPHLVCLAGVVLGADGRPGPGACVFPPASPRQIAVTNAQGAFQLQGPAYTAFSLQAELMGLGSSRVAIAGEPAQPVRSMLGR